MITFIQGIFKPYFDQGNYVQPCPNSKVRLAKVFNRSGATQNPEMPKFYNVLESTNPTSLKQVEHLLRDYQDKTDVAMLRGVPVSSMKNIRRNSETFNCSIRSRIVHMDIDGIDSDIDGFDVETQGRYCIGLLHKLDPEVFPEHAAFVAKASGSAGVKKGIRLHIYLNSSVPVSNAQLKYYAYKINTKSKEEFGYELLDTSVYDKVHLMYTANPIFENPESDPFVSHERIVRIDGEVIELPENLKEYKGMASYNLDQSHYGYIEDIEGLCDYPSARFENRIKALEDAKDNVFMRHSISVYASAIEEGVDIKWLDRKVEKILQNYDNRGRTVEQYISNAKAAALKIVLSRSLRRVDGDINVSIDSTEDVMLPVEEIPTGSEEDDLFLQLPELPPEGKMTFVKASLGTGKTTSVQSWLSSGKFKGRFLSVTNTVSLVEGNAKKLESGCYNKVKDFNEFRDQRINRMCTTIHSLHRFYDTINNNGIDMLFIDEADAVMNDILFSDLIREKPKCIKTLQLILREAKYIVLSDGDISPETIEAYARLCDPVKPIVIYKHDRKMLSEAQAIELFDESSIWAAMQGSLQIGEKCLLVSDCSPDELNEKAISLRATTAANVKEIHKNSTKDSDIKDILTWGNAALQEQRVDALLCSPSVTSGVDFRYFDTVFVLTRDAGIHAPNLRFQALRRDRGAKFIYYYTAPQTEGFQAGASSYNENLGWAALCQKMFARRRENECTRYKSTFRMLLRDQGCMLTLDPSDWGKIESSEKDYRQQRIDAILSATPNFQLQRHGDAWEIKQFIVKYFDLMTESDVELEHVESWLDKKPHDRAKFFHTVFKNYWPILKKCETSWYPFIDDMRRFPNKWYQTTGMDVRTEEWRVKRYLKMMGLDFDEPGEFETIISWYRTYCIIESIQIPAEFMTDSELFLSGDKDMIVL